MVRLGLLRPGDNKIIYRSLKRAPLKPGCQVFKRERDRGREAARKRLRLSTGLPAFREREREGASEREKEIIYRSLKRVPLKPGCQVFGTLPPAPHLPRSHPSIPFRPSTLPKPTLFPQPPFPGGSEALQRGREQGEGPGLRPPGRCRRQPGCRRRPAGIEAGGRS